MTDITQSRHVAAVPGKVRRLPRHATVGTNDLDAASIFYRRLLAVFGIGRSSSSPTEPSTTVIARSNSASSSRSTAALPSSATVE